MTEFELKFEISPKNFPGVAAAMQQGKVLRQRLQASYFDTPEGALAKHGIVVRLRKEGRRWVQTAKGPTTQLLARLEHNACVPLPKAGATPVLDLSRHSGTPVGEAINKALARQADGTWPGLRLLYGTDIQRMTKRIALNGSVVEVALDQGRVFAGGPLPASSQTICELEFELIEGSPLDAVALARQWCAQHGLWLSTIAKSTKGQRLGQAVPYDSATSAVPCVFARDASADEMLSAVVATCLNQILPNMSEIASGSNQSEHLHQLRVGIRRLRTALQELGVLSDAIEPQWGAALVRVFRALGAQRDQSNLALVLLPQLQAAGGPAMRLKAPDSNVMPVTDVVQANDFQDTLLGLLAFLYRDIAQPVDGSKSLKKTMSLRLEKLYKRAVYDGKKFLKLGQEQQHGVRKRLKRLRYLMEFAGPLFAAQKMDRMTKALKPVQDALGLYNNELIALNAWQALAANNPKAWFGIGWLTARKQPNARRCLKKIRSFAKVRPFWRV